MTRGIKHRMQKSGHDFLPYVSKFPRSECSNSLLAKNHRENILKRMIWDLNSKHTISMVWLTVHSVNILNLENMEVRV